MYTKLQQTTDRGHIKWHQHDSHRQNTSLGDTVPVELNEVLGAGLANHVIVEGAEGLVGPKLPRAQVGILVAPEVGPPRARLGVSGGL